MNKSNKLPDSFLDFKDDEIPETFDTFLLEPQTFRSKIKLYHYTHKKLTKISPITLSAGNKLSKPRLASWWTPYEDAGGWIIFTTVKAMFPELKWKKYIYTTRINSYGDVCPVGVIAESLYKANKQFIDNIKIYRYEKEFNGNEIGMGTEYATKEYTVYKEVIPDKVKILTIKDVLKNGDLKIVPDDQIDIIGKEFMKKKSEGKYLADLIREKPSYYYTLKEGKQIKEEFKKQNPNIQLYSDAARLENKSVKESYFSDLDIQRQEFDDTPTQTGFMDEKTRRWNSLIEVDGKKYRERCEALIIKDNQIYLAFKNKDEYKIPGGSTEPNKNISSQVIAETKEEARLKIKNIKYILTYKDEYKKIPDYMKKFPKENQWIGHHTHLFICEYDGEYNGKVEDVDKDPFIYKNGKFYDIDEVYDKLTPEHKMAIDTLFDKSIVFETDLYKSHINFEPNITLEGTKSQIDKDFKSKGSMNLSSFKKIHITESIIDKYKKDYPILRHVRCKDTKQYTCDGYIWMDKDKLVCTVGSCEYKDDFTKWIVSLEIMSEYKGYGLSKQILDYAVKTMKCNYLSVNKNNEVAKNIYDKYGFKVYQEDDTMYYMCYGAVNKALEAKLTTKERNALKFEKIVEFNKKLNNMEYILPFSKDPIRITHESYLKDYKMLTPREFEKYNGGICWDYVAYESWYFTKYFPNVKFKSYYVINIDNYNNPTHTFIIFEYDGYYYYFESSWKHNHGIFKFKKEKDALTYTLKKINDFYFKQNKNTLETYSGLYIAQYNPLDKKLFGMSCVEYMEYMSNLIKGPIKLTKAKEPLEIITEPLSYSMESYSSNENELTVFEAKLTTKERNALKDEEFGLPSKRKYPLHDKQHVLDAIRFFNYCSKEDRDELAANIIKAIDKFFDDGEKMNINVGKNNVFKKYWTKPEKATEALNNKNNFYFYHFTPKNANIDLGLFSPKYMYDNNMKDLFIKSTNKYRERLVNGWGYYKNKKPDELTTDEIFNVINKFRKSENGLSFIYFFRFPPYEELGKKMKDFIKTHDCYRIDLDDPETKKYIKEIYWNREMSHSDGKELNEDYYRNISVRDYFAKYDDSSKINFAALNHIGIRFKDDYCPKKLLTKVDLNKETQVVTNTHMIISCFAGVGKNYAIDYYKSLGYKVDSIEKYADFYKVYPNPKVDFVKDIIKKSSECDILFIPYYLGMEKRHIMGKVDYYLIYPDKSQKDEYIERFKKIGFTEDQIEYLNDNFYDMINDCSTCKIPNSNKFTLKKGEFCTTVINKLLKANPATEALGDIGDSKFIIDSFSSMFNIANINKITKNLLSIHDDIKSFDIKSIFTKLTVKNHRIEIEGINFKRMLLRMEETYGTKKILNILGKEYKAYDEYLFKNKRITRNKMRITKFVVHEFFALELFNIFAELEDKYDDSNYRKICALLQMKTWIGNIGKTQIDKLDISKLKNLTYELQPYQKEFIQNYPILKNVLGLNGYVLAFEQGLGKTLTSISLAECMDKEKIYILCPNKLTGNWADEIKAYYKKYDGNDELYYQEVCVLNNNKFKMTDKTRFIITNQENIKGMMEYAKDCDNILIIDESHNFRNMKGSRVKELLSLKDKLNCKDVLLCSGTPIKAVPSEIVPSLLMIDPIFDMEAAEIFTKCFNISNTSASNIIKTRFGYVMYRKDKSELSLPEKFITNMKVTIKNADKYALKTIRDKVSIRFRAIFEEKVKHNEEKQEIFVKYLKKYSTAPNSIYKLYYDKMIIPANSEIMVDMHESEKEIISTYIDTYVIPNVPKDELKAFNRAYTEYIRMRQSAIGLALGEILPKARTEMYIAMYEENKEKFINIIENNDKKVVIFSQFKQVVDYICDDLNSYGIGTVKVTGDIKNAYDNIKRFKEDGAIDVIVATSQTMGTGQTLVEANKMFFFGPPWRSTDFDQCCDRIHRIGQTTPVYIHNVILDTPYKNLSSRMHDILDWSNDMFTGYITDNLKEDVEKIITESYINLGIVDTFELLENKFNLISMESNIGFESSDKSCDDFLNNISTIFDNIKTENDAALEEAFYDNKHKYPIFITLMHTGTTLANIVKRVTGDQFSHACISFNSNLNPLFSFGKKDFESDPGFAVNNPESDFYKKFKTKYNVYVMFVTKQELNTMKKKLQVFIDNQDKLKYNLIALIFNYFNIPTEWSKKYFCSRFVATIIGSAKKLNMKPSLYRPQDLSYIQDISLVAQGDDLSKYDYKKTEKEIEKIKRK